MTTMRQRRSQSMRGLTLLEVLIVVTVVGLLIAVAIPTYQDSRNKANISAAKKDILEYSVALEKYFLVRHRYPTSLDELGPVRTDPWGTPYQYLSMEGATTGQKRKDKSLNPLNSDFDLYSNGPDKASQKPLTAAASRDDIVRANNGGFVGVAQDF